MAALVAVGGPTLGLRFAGGSTHETALGDVAIEITPAAPGRVDLYIPLADWGVRARAIDAPLELAAEPRTLDRQALIRAADGDRDVIAEARDDLRAAANAALLRAVLYGLLGAVAAALIVVLVMRSTLRVGWRQAIGLAAIDTLIPASWIVRRHPMRNVECMTRITTNAAASAPTSP